MGATELLSPKRVLVFGDLMLDQYTGQQFPVNRGFGRPSSRHTPARHELEVCVRTWEDWRDEERCQNRNSVSRIAPVRAQSEVCA